MVFFMEGLRWGACEFGGADVLARKHLDPVGWPCVTVFEGFFRSLRENGGIVGTYDEPTRSGEPWW